MKLYYRNCNNSEDKELIEEFNNPQEVADCILNFLNECKFHVHYFRIGDCRGNDGSGFLNIDFGSYYQFYYVEGCELPLRDFANILENRRELFYRRIKQEEICEYAEENLKSAREYVVKRFNIDTSSLKSKEYIEYYDTELLYYNDGIAYDKEILSYEDILNILIICLVGDMDVESSHVVADNVILRFMQLTMCDDKVYTKEQADRLYLLFDSMFKYYA